METLSFYAIPDLKELLPSGGRPGFDYALVCVERLNDLKSDTDANWDIIANCPAIEVFGQPAILMGKGAAIPGGSPESTVPQFWVDEKLEANTPVEPTNEEPVQEDSDNGIESE